MATNRAAFWRVVFRTKAVYNCVSSVAFFLAEDWLRDRMSVYRPDPVYRSLFLALAFTFGLGYWWVGRNLERNHDIIRMGILGQLSVFSVLAYAVGAGNPSLPWPYILPGVIDLTFAVAFFVFLLTYPRCVWNRP
jgi:hypothetical protein